MSLMIARGIASGYAVYNYTALQHNISDLVGISVLGASPRPVLDFVREAVKPGHVQALESLPILARRRAHGSLEYFAHGSCV